MTELNYKKAARLIYGICLLQTVVLIFSITRISQTPELTKLVELSRQVQPESIFLRYANYIPSMTLAAHIIFLSFCAYCIGTGNKLIRVLYTIVTLVSFLMSLFYLQLFQVTSAHYLGDWGHRFSFVSLIQIAIDFFVLYFLYKEKLTSRFSNKTLLVFMVSYFLFTPILHGGVIFYLKSLIDMKSFEASGIRINLTRVNIGYRTTGINGEVYFSEDSVPKAKFTGFVDNFSFYNSIPEVTFEVILHSFSPDILKLLKPASIIVRGKFNRGVIEDISIKAKNLDVEFSEIHLKVSALEFISARKDFINQAEFTLLLNKGKIEKDVHYLNFDELELKHQINFSPTKNNTLVLNGKKVFYRDEAIHSQDSLSPLLTIGFKSVPLNNVTDYKNVSWADIVKSFRQITSLYSSFKINQSDEAHVGIVMEEGDLFSDQKKLNSSLNLPISLIKELNRIVFRDAFFNKYKYNGEEKRGIKIPSWFSLFPWESTTTFEQLININTQAWIKKLKTDYGFSEGNNVLSGRIEKNKILEINDKPIFDCHPLNGESSLVVKDTLMKWSEDKLFDFVLEKIGLFRQYGLSDIDALCALDISDQLGHEKLKLERQKLREFLTKRFVNNIQDQFPFPELKLFTVKVCLSMGEATPCSQAKDNLLQLAQEFPQHPMVTLMEANLARSEGHLDQFSSKVKSINLEKFDMNQPWDRLSKKVALIQKAILLRHEKKIGEALNLYRDNETLFSSEFIHQTLAEQLLERSDVKSQEELDRHVEQIRTISRGFKFPFIVNYLSMKAEYFFLQKKNQECIHFFSKTIEEKWYNGTEAYLYLATCYERNNEFDKAADTLKGSCMSYNQGMCLAYIKNTEKAGRDAEKIAEEECLKNIGSLCLYRALGLARKKDLENGFKFLKMGMMGGSQGEMALEHFSPEDRQLLRTVAEFKGEKFTINEPIDNIKVNSPKQNK